MHNVLGLGWGCVCAPAESKDVSTPPPVFPCHVLSGSWPDLVFCVSFERESPGLENCWEAYSGANLRASLTSQTYSIAALEIQLKCEDAGKLKLMHYNDDNAKLRAWYNLEEVTVATTETTQQTIPISSTDAHPTLRLELSRDDETKDDASITAEVKVTDAKASFEGCMDFKERPGQCMGTFGAAPNVALISNHTLQFECQTGDDATRQTIEHCDEWYRCYDDDTREKLVTLLRGVVMPAPTMTTASLVETDAPTSHGGCINPEVFNVEAFECNCFDAIKDMTAEELHEITCNHVDVCCTWKETHCSSPCSSELLARRSNNTAAKEIDNSNKDSLDSSLQVKTCE